MYALGIDLGTTYSAAAIATLDGRAEMMPLEHASVVIPSVIAISAGDEPVIGQAAQRRAVTHPTSVGREFKRRFGDTTPILLDGQPHQSQQLMAYLAKNIIDKATSERGEPPAAVAITYPANWGPYKQELLRDVGKRAGRADAAYFDEPTAAASWYAHQARIEVGDMVVVYDFGGGTFDSVVLRRGVGGFEVVGEATGIERLGGIDLDEVVVSFVLRSAGVDLAALDPSDPATLAAMARLRDEARSAKEALSSDTSTHLLVELGGVSLQVRLTRSEFEDLVRPSIRDTLISVRQAVDSAGVTLDDLSAVLLVGGSSRVPLVAEVVGSETGLPITADAHSKNSVALGAALLGLDSLRPARDVEAVAPVAAEASPGSETATVSVPSPSSEARVKSASTPFEQPAAGDPKGPPFALIGAGLAVVAIIVVGIVLATGGGDGSASSTTAAAPPTTEAAVSATTSVQPDETVGDVGVTDTIAPTSEVDVVEEPVAPGRSDSWVTGAHADPGRTDNWRSPGPTTLPSVIWRSSDLVGGDPVAVDGVMYASFQDETVRAVDLATGEDIWVRETSFGSRTPAISEDGLFYVDAFDVVAVDRATGTEELYRLTPPSEAIEISPQAPTVVDGRLYVVYSGFDDGTWTNDLFAIDLDSGEVLWHWPNTAEQSALPVIVDAGAVTVVVDGGVFVLESATGAERWSAELTGDISPNEALAVDGVLVLRDSRLRAFDLANGEQLWSDPDSDLRLAHADGFVFTHSLDMRAVDIATGDLVWSTRWDGPLISGAIAIGEGVVYGNGTSNGGLAAYDIATGAELWKLVDEEVFESSQEILIHDGYLVGVDQQRRLVVYG
ncbi:MAG: Hsp70 family protein [Actinomycetia bacterium]|nr:Hsp70 family protein [Actinomycetes bacterium]